jgi:hypothetical protein
VICVGCGGAGWRVLVASRKLLVAGRKTARHCF